MCSSDLFAFGQRVDFIDDDAFEASEDAGGIVVAEEECEAFRRGIQKTRSCLILQNDPMNQYGQLTIVIPFRPGIKQAPYVVNVTAAGQNGLDQDRFLDVGQIRSIDGQRVLGLVGILEDHYWQQIQAALSIVCGFGLE